MTDRLLHYQSQAEQAKPPSHSFYALAACVCAVLSIGLATAVRTGALEMELWGLAIPAAVFTEVAALLGCFLAVFERTRRRTFVWLAIVLILCNPFLYSFLREVAWRLFGFLPTF